MTDRIDVAVVNAGEVRAKQAQLDGGGPIFVRHLRTMLGRMWTDARPVYA